MPTSPLDLPKDKEELADLIDTHVKRERANKSNRMLMWRIAHAYLQGARKFKIGRLSATGQYDELGTAFVDPDGKMAFQAQDLLSMINQVAGRLQSIDHSPAVVSDPVALEGLRGRAVAQTILDSLFNRQNGTKVKKRFVMTLTTLGMAGLAGDVVDLPSVGLIGDPEVVHPQELMPFPSLGMDYNKQWGLLRERYVSMDRLRRAYPGKLPASGEGLNKLDWGRHRPGQILSVNDEGSDPTTGPMTPGKGEVKVVKVRELWLDGPAETCSRYILASGKTIIQDLELAAHTVYCPIGVERFMETGSFYGAGMFDLLYPILRQFERLLKQNFDNVMDSEKFGAMILPMGLLNKNAVLRDIGEGLKAYFVDPDEIAEQFNPITIQPFNTRDIPGRTAVLARQAADAVNPFQDLLSEKGRVDSASGLAFLNEKINEATTNPMSAVRNAYGAMYRGALQRAINEMRVTGKSVKLSRITMDMAGTVVDPDAGTLSVTDGRNPVPNVASLQFTVKEATPRSLEARVGRGVELHQAMGMFELDPDGFFLWATDEQLDIPMWTKEFEAARASIERDIVVLFGDGESSNMIFPGPHLTLPGFQRRILKAFMAMPIMRMASVEVQNAFSEYDEALMSWMGPVLPQGVPGLDELPVTPTVLQGQAVGALPGLQPQGAIANG